MYIDKVTGFRTNNDFFMQIAILSRFPTDTLIYKNLKCYFASHVKIKYILHIYMKYMSTYNIHIYETYYKYDHLVCFSHYADHMLHAHKIYLTYSLLLF